MLIFTLILSAVSPALADMTNANYQITKSVMSCDDMTMDSTSYQMTTTIGQPSTIKVGVKS